MNDDMSHFSSIQDVLCGNYHLWENDVKVLYLERKIALLISQLSRKEQLADNHSRLLSGLAKKYKASTDSARQANDKLKEVQKELEAAKADLEKKVAQRTKTLEEKNRQLFVQARELKEANIALDVLLKKKDNDVRKQVQGCLSQLDSNVLPELQKLAGLVRRKEQQALVFKVISAIQDSSILQPDEGWTACLSGKESAISKLIVQEKTHAQIAQSLGLSVRTIDAHCYRIRKKLHVPARTRLKDFLVEMSRAD